MYKANPMNQLRTLFQKIDLPNPQGDLEKRILCRIKVLEENQVRQALLITHIGRSISIVALLLIGLSFGHSIITSEFWELASLLFTDAGIVMNYFSDFAYSLLETLPAFPIALILMPILSFLLFQFWSFNINIRRYPSLSFHNA